MGIEMVGKELGPLPAKTTWPIFLGLGALGFLFLTLGTPWMSERFAIAPHTAMKLASVFLYTAITVTGLAILRSEGTEFSFTALKERLRFHSISKKQWALVLLGVLLVDGTYIVLSALGPMIADALPGWFSAPYRAMPETDLSGAYLALFLFSALITFNVISEEFLWRGVLLPRQELAHGRNAWWIHAVQWTMFHWFQGWYIPAILPGALVYGWLATRTKSIIPGIVLHFGLNGLGIIMMAIKVFS